MGGSEARRRSAPRGGGDEPTAEDLAELARIVRTLGDALTRAERDTMEAWASTRTS
ncbi:hypothetical protein [Saccharopolyspora hordei]|uniref:Uncharacterized protein n=1 Tax=Saccharopolyspora hordei TaxID=1838 RepID=A0A853ACB2_9PSEU|nr:hypothetical protein [Saccharopolyspora hordei]NYI82082.1 hypothetical protein [Saccharopolyspora hordei]